MDDTQLYLDFADSTALNLAESPSKSTASNHAMVSQMRRAVIRWLLTQEPRVTGCGCDISCGARLPRLDVCAFWTQKARGRSPRKAVLSPTPSVGVICCGDESECYAICSQPPEAMSELAELHREMRKREELIRQNEPQLQNGSALFPEYGDWDYSRTSDQEYLKLAGQAAHLEKTILAGTRLERTLRKGYFSGIYLAVPAGTLDATDLPVDCGILWVHDDLTVEVRRELTLREVAPANQMMLATRIAAAATRAASELYGIRMNSKGAFFVKPPRLRRKKEKPTLPQA